MYGGRPDWDGNVEAARKAGAAIEQAVATIEQKVAIANEQVESAERRESKHESQSVCRLKANQSLAHAGFGLRQRMTTAIQ